MKLVKMNLYKKDSVWCKFILIVMSLMYVGECFHIKPNIVIFLADDMGFGDLQSFGNPLSSTPNIDALERGGLKFTQFYSTDPICSPSRAGLLTGRYAVRTGIWDNDTESVLLPKHTGGLPLNETTIPEMLAHQGYKSIIIGKWHLGVGPDGEFLPLNHGFDHFFGTPYCHQACASSACFYPNVECDNKGFSSSVPCVLMLENEIIEQPLLLVTLAQRQARAARSWIHEYSCKRTPFFLFYSFLHPHYPHFADKRHINSTIGGQYTDALAELDWQVGEVMDELRKNRVLDNTLILFSSDNGPELRYQEKGGFSGGLRCGKHTTFEGGSRVPTIAYWPGRIPGRVSTELLSHLDIWPTLLKLSGSSPEEFHLILDGYDISDVLFNNGKSPRHSLLYYDSTPDPNVGPYSIRTQRYKAHFVTEIVDTVDTDDVDDMCRAGTPSVTSHSPPLLFDLLLDPEERNNIGNDTEYTSIVEMMTTLMEKESHKVVFADSVLKQTDDGLELCCDSGCIPYPTCCQCPSKYSDVLFPVNIECPLSQCR